MKFTWYGKENAIIESMTPSTGTLRPDKESSKDWDDTENLYIEGDNLEVLKLLQKSYFGKVKMIYIDPPYNTGKDFIYKDNFKDNIANYKEITNQSTKANPETNGRYHTDWLNMMYPRLKLARNLLREEGVIFISIDDTEHANLKIICDEIFGEHNFIANFLWKKKSTSTNTTNARVSSLTDSILVYCKNDTNISIKPRVVSKETRNYNFSDELGNYRTTIIEKKDSGEYKRETMKYKILGQQPRNGKRWQIGEEKARELEKNNRFFIDDSGVVKLKIYDFEDKNTTSAHPNLLDKMGSTDSASKYVNNKLFNVEGLFSNPKPIELIKYFIEISTDEDSIIMDFFSGSSTTADALIHSELEQRLNRKFIMVQLPEQTGEKSEAYKAEYKNICEIGKDRIKKAGDKILEENKDKEGIENLDIGFKVFKLEYNCGGENHSMMEEGIKVDIIKRPKDKPICKFKVYGELYYLVKTNEDIIVFPYKSSIKGKVIASIFNIKLCKNKDYMQLEYLYNMKLNEFNGEDFIHSQYVTSVILDNVYKNLNE